MSTAGTSRGKARGWFLYTRKDSPGWILRYLEPRSGAWREHRIPREFTAKRQAEAYAVAWLDELHRQGERPDLPVVPKPDRGPTLRELRDRWIELRNGKVIAGKLRPATVDADRANLDTHVLPRIGDVPILDLGTGPLRRFVRELSSAPATPKNAKPGTKRKAEPRTLAPYTVRNIANTLSTFLDDAIGEEWIGLPANPMKLKAVRQELPKGVRRAGKNTIIHLTRDQAERLCTCEAVPEDRRVRYLLAVTSGLRDGEIAGLTWGDTDLDSEIPIVSVTKQLAMRGRKGWGTVSEPKTEDGVRTLPLHHLATRALKAFKKGGWVRLVGRNPKPSDPVFPGFDDLGRVQAHRPKSGALIRADLAAAGCSTTFAGHNIEFHATRRSFATWLAAADVQEAVIKRLMGHAAAGVTAAHYTARVLETMQAAVERITLDLTAGQVVALPVRMVAGDGTPESRSPGDLPFPVTDRNVAGCDVGATLASVNAPELPRKLRSHPGDLNPRPAVYELSEKCGRVSVQGCTNDPSAAKQGDDGSALDAPRRGNGTRDDGCDVGCDPVIVARDVLRQALDLLDRGDLESAKRLLRSAMQASWRRS